jgi:AcrR family transcriptional regulator
MPKQTFLNLPDEKRDPILRAALEEFSCCSYHAASVNIICRNSGIPKGSFYQYFENKMDLYVHLMLTVLEQKNAMLQQTLAQSGDMCFFDRLKALYAAGFSFAATHPLLAELGNRFAAETEQKVKVPVLAAARKPSEDVFTTLVLQAQQAGDIRSDLPVDQVLLLLFAVNQQIGDAIKGYRDVRRDEMEEERATRAKNAESAANRLLDMMLRMVFEGIGNRHEPRMLYETKPSQKAGKS